MRPLIQLTYKGQLYTEVPRSVYLRRRGSELHQNSWLNSFTWSIWSTHYPWSPESFSQSLAKWARPRKSHSRDQPRSITLRSLHAKLRDQHRKTLLVSEANLCKSDESAKVLVAECTRRHAQNSEWVVNTARCSRHFKDLHKSWTLEIFRVFKSLIEEKDQDLKPLRIPLRYRSVLLQLDDQYLQ